MSAQILHQLLQAQGVVGSQGSTTFNLAGISTPIVDISVVGSLIQEWLEVFMHKHGVVFSKPTNSQTFPGFFMSQASTTADLLEIKCFTQSANFDVANFNAYCRSLMTDAYRLDADYLIFEYAAAGHQVTIKNIWLKKVWEVSGGSARSAVKLQWKQNQAFNIRPTTWYSAKTAYPPFQSRRDFVNALKQIFSTQPAYVSNWFQTVCNNYLRHTGQPL